MYKKLVEFCQSGQLSFKHVVTFNMDEYVGIPRDHPESYHTYMFKNLFNHIDIDPANVHILDGNAPDLMQECNQFEEKIKAVGGVELFIGGEPVMCVCTVHTYVYVFVVLLRMYLSMALLCMHVCTFSSYHVHTYVYSVITMCFTM